MKISFTTPSEEYLNYYFKGLSDKEIYRYMPIHYHTLQDTHEQLDFYKRGMNEGTARHLNVLFNDEFALFNINEKHRRAEVGYWFLREFQGRGVAYESLKMFIAKFWNELNLHRIEAEIDSRNIPSKKLIQKLGFKHEGTKRQCEWEDQIPVNIEWYSLLKHEWNN